VLPKPSTRHKTKVVPTFVKDSANPAFLYTALILWHCDYFLLINELQSLLLPPRPLYSTIYEGVFLYCIQTTERYHGLILSMEHHNLFLPSLRHDSSHCCSGLDGRCSFCHCSDTHGYRTHHSKSGRCNSKFGRRNGIWCVLLVDQCHSFSPTNIVAKSRCPADSFFGF
jgi:hypothetical protein